MIDVRWYMGWVAQQTVRRSRTAAMDQLVLGRGLGREMSKPPQSYAMSCFLAPLPLHSPPAPLSGPCDMHIIKSEWEKRRDSRDGSLGWVIPVA